MWQILPLIFFFVFSGAVTARDIRHMTTPQKIQLIQKFIRKNFNAQHTHLLQWKNTGEPPVPKLPLKLERAYLHQIKLLKSYAEEVRHTDSKKSLRALTLSRSYQSLLKRVEAAKARELELVTKSGPRRPEDVKSGGFEFGLRVLALPIVSELRDSSFSEKVISRFTAVGLATGYSGGKRLLYRVQGSYIFGAGDIVGENIDFNQERAILSGILVDLQVGYAFNESIELFAGPTFKSLNIKTQESATEVKEAGSKIAPTLELRYVVGGLSFSTSALLSNGVGFSLNAGLRF